MAQLQILYHAWLDSYSICRPIFKTAFVFQFVVIAQIKRFVTLKAMQKTASLYTAPLLKKSGKTCLKIVKTAFFLKNGRFLAVFLDFFENGAL